ncbi:nitrate/nitrite transporter [Saccharicrinis sp. FJH62]|uniref:MFS transporter n=1 Tax=Saccharicrinis sp. FJH62 TaxID=3344657 RepID=UPI0035D50AE0
MRNISDIPFNPSKFKFFYGWIIVVAGTVGVIFSIPGQTMGVSVFTDHLIEALKLDRDTLSIAYMLGTIASSFLLTYAGVLYDRFGARYVAIGAAAFLGISLIFASYSPAISNAVSSFLNIRFSIVSFTVISIIFFLIRISGQGVLTMVSRNMIMKWFDKLRGRANAISSAFVSFGFAISPLIFSILIQNNSWPVAWRIIAVALMAFAVFAFIFYRDNPEESGMKPDGKTMKVKKETVVQRRQFTLKEAQKTWPFWVFTFALAFYSFFGTGFTFNIESIFETFGYDKTAGIKILIPISVVSIAVSLIGNFISDFVRLQYLLFVLIFGQLLSTIGIVLLGSSLGYFLTVAGFGIMGGMFVVLVSVTWPRFYGRKHLGAISGFSGSILVFSSATGPFFFSKILTLTKGYQLTGIIGIAMVIILAGTSLKAKNPQ